MITHHSKILSGCCVLPAQQESLFALSWQLPVIDFEKSCNRATRALFSRLPQGCFRQFSLCKAIPANSSFMYSYCVHYGTNFSGKVLPKSIVTGSKKQMGQIQTRWYECARLNAWHESAMRMLHWRCSGYFRQSLSKWWNVQPTESWVRMRVSRTVSTLPYTLVWDLFPPKSNLLSQSATLCQKFMSLTDEYQWDKWTQEQILNTKDFIVTAALWFDIRYFGDHCSLRVEKYVQENETIVELPPGPDSVTEAGGGVSLGHFQFLHCPRFDFSLLKHWHWRSSSSNCTSLLLSSTSSVFQGELKWWYWILIALFVLLVIIIILVALLWRQKRKRWRFLHLILKNFSRCQQESRSDDYMLWSRHSAVVPKCAFWEVNTLRLNKNVLFCSPILHIQEIKQDKSHWWTNWWVQFTVSNEHSTHVCVCAFPSNFERLKTTNHSSHQKRIFTYSSICFPEKTRKRSFTISAVTFCTDTHHSKIFWPSSQ